MNAHNNALDGLQVLERQVAHMAKVLHHNGFAVNGLGADPELVAHITGLYNRIDRIKKIVLLDAHEQDLVTITEPVPKTGNDR
jgi:hypothetical protein